MIELKNVSKRFGQKTAVNDLDLAIPTGEITMLIGPSGCGKTTTLKMINRLIEATSGEIAIDGKSIYDMNATELRRGIGYVIQEVGLFPHMTVYDNIGIVPRLLGWTEKRINARVDELLNLVTLNTSYARKYPLQLSGGERQRVGLARALAADPEVLLMDEPFGAIDPINRAKLHDSFVEIQQQIRKTIVFVTHDINEAIKLGDKIAILRNGDLVQFDNVRNILYEPENEFVERLLGHDRNLKALVLKRNSDYVRTDGFVRVRSDDSPPKVTKTLADARQRFAYAADSNGRLAGMFVLNRIKGRDKLEFVDEFVSVEKNSNVQQTFSMMIEAGESQLPVVDAKRTFVGVVRLEDIFHAFSNEE